MNLYRVTRTNTGTPLLSPTFAEWRARFGPGEGKDSEGGRIHATSDAWPAMDGYTKEGRIGTTGPGRPPMLIAVLMQCSAMIYVYRRGHEFLGAIGFHAPCGSLSTREASRGGVDFQGPIAEARRYDFGAVLPADVGVVLAAGSQTFVTPDLRQAAKLEYQEILRRCKAEGVPGNQVIVYISAGDFGVTSEGRLGESRKAPRIR